MALSRYAIIDAYTLEELRRKYHVSDAKGRIRLLKLLHGTNRPPYQPPFEIALLAANDPNVEVRQWMARFGWLDFREHQGEGHNRPASDPSDSDRDLKELLRRDPDQFVRACLRENANFLSPIGLDLSQWLAEFQSASHLERLGLVRNCWIRKELIEKVFDPGDRQLGIDLPQRAELVFAFLSNPIASRYPETEDAVNPYTGYWALGTTVFFSNLWGLASKWPSETGVPHSVYSHVRVDDDAKAKTYQRCEDRFLRMAILESSTRRDSKTVNLGIKDPDERCRELAYSRIYESNPAFREALKAGDKTALTGLAKNAGLSSPAIEMVRNRLQELGDELGSWDASETIAKRGLPPDDPYNLFDDGNRAKYTDEKLSFLGKKLLVMEPELAPSTDTQVQFETLRRKRLANWPHHSFSGMAEWTLVHFLRRIIRKLFT